MEHEVHGRKAGVLFFVRSCVRTGEELEISCDSVLCAVFSFILQAMALVIGESGVPYLLKASDSQSETFASQSHCILGELWEVSSEALQGLDEYEGVNKGYYSRINIPVHGKGFFSAFGLKKDYMADVYVLNNASEELKNRPRINEYTLDMHRQLYNAIMHVQRKQHAYLGWSASTWGKMPDREVSADGASSSS
jgi:hypothetical protein